MSNAERRTSALGARCRRRTHPAPMTTDPVDSAKERQTSCGRRRLHVARVLPSPMEAVYSTHIDSDLHFGRHWHDSYGFGFLEHGAQAWWSGRGHVRGYPGDVITTNPGEVHDGQPIGEPTRRWRIVYIDVDVMASVTGHYGQHAEIARPVISDSALIRALGRLFSRIEVWNAHRGASGNHADALAFEDALVDSCVQLMARHGSAPVPIHVPSHDLSLVRERLVDALSEAPTL